MAVPSYTTDLQTYNDCTSVTGWLELIGMALSAPPDIDTDLAIHGSVCISSDRAKTGLSSNAFVGAGFSLAAGECIFVWHKFFAPNSLATLANGGVRVMVGDSSSVYDGWYLDGSDTYPYGGWVNHVVDPTTTPDQTAGTTTGTYAMVGNGWNLPTQAPSKGNPFGTDIIRYGRGESRFTGGEVGDYATFDGYALVNDHPTTGRFGLLQAIAGGYLFKGLMSLGLTATAVDMRDANVSITIDNTLKVGSGFNRIEIHNAASNIEWTNISFTALGTVSKGQFEMVDNATLTDVGGVFTGMDTFIYQSNATVTSRTYRSCGQVTLGGASFVSCIFASSTAANSTTTITLSNLDECSFESDGSNHAVELTGSAGSYGWTCSLIGYDAGSSGSGVEVTGGSITGNEAIHITAATGTFDITVATGASIPSVSSAGAIVNVIAGAVDVTVTAINVSGAAVDDVAIALYAANATGDLPYQEAITISNSGTTATVIHNSHGMITNDKVLIRLGDQPYNRGVFQITVTDANTYTYTTSSAPTGDPSGCNATWTSIYETLSGTNTFTKSRTFGNNQPVIGWVRKSTNSPFYVTAPIAGTIGSSTGVSLTALMLSDGG